MLYISPKTRQKCNKENRKSLIIKNFRFLLRDSVGRIIPIFDENPPLSKVIKTVHKYQ